MPDDDLVDAIKDLLAQGPFHGEGYRKVWARLRFAGIRTSKRRVLRLTGEHGLQAPGRVGRPRGPKAQGEKGTTRDQFAPDCLLRQDAQSGHSFQHRHHARKALEMRGVGRRELNQPHPRRGPFRAVFGLSGVSFSDAT
jgi:hypothetical protein